jgi:hypothetical protein
MIDSIGISGAKVKLVKSIWDTVITQLLEDGEIVGVVKFLDVVGSSIVAFNLAIVRILHMTVTLST